MSLLDGKLEASSLIDRMTFKGLTIGCGITFLTSMIAFPVIGFGAFTARDENGWITGIMALTALIWLASGLLLVVWVIVAWIQRKDTQDDTLLPEFSSHASHIPPPPRP
jgi:hypothetical protein